VPSDVQQPTHLHAVFGSLLSREAKTQVPARPVAVASPPPQPSSPSFLLLTLDSCRYDVMCDARTPVLDRYVGEFLPAQTPANFTYAAHHAFFAGILPHVAEPRAYYNRFVRQLFA